MKIDVLGAQAFVAIAEHGNFQRAADSLHITQTALSRRLQNLENYLGVTLVERTTRSVALSPVGQEFLPQARRLLEELAAALSGMRASGRSLDSTVSVACISSLAFGLVPHILRAFAQLSPAPKVRVVDALEDEVADIVARGEVELGLSLAGEWGKAVEATPLLADRIVLACRKDHAFARRRSVRWKELEGQSMVVPGPGTSGRKFMDAALQEVGVALGPCIEVQRVTTGLGLAAGGLAPAFTPSLALRNGIFPELRPVRLVEPEIDRQYVLLTRRGAPLSAAASTLRELICERAADALD